MVYMDTGKIIREHYNTGISYTALAQKYDIPVSTLYYRVAHTITECRISGCDSEMSKLPEHAKLQYCAEHAAMYYCVDEVCSLDPLSHTEFTRMLRMTQQLKQMPKDRIEAFVKCLTYK